MSRLELPLCLIATAAGAIVADASDAAAAAAPPALEYAPPVPPAIVAAFQGLRQACTDWRQASPAVADALPPPATGPRLPTEPPQAEICRSFLPPEGFGNDFFVSGEFVGGFIGALAIATLFLLRSVAGIVTAPFRRWRSRGSVRSW